MFSFLLYLGAENVIDILLLFYYYIINLILLHIIVPEGGIIMAVDYKQLCQELFGTADVDALRQIADKLHQENPRNAGRKPKFSAGDIEEMQKMRQNGSGMGEIAEAFHTSRQIVGKYLNAKPAPGYTMRMTLMYQTHPCTVIDVNFLDQKIKIQNRTSDLLHRAFGCIENPNWENFEYFLQDRCFPATRGNVKQLLKAIGVPNYDPLAVVEKTKGRMAEDQLWIKFNYYDRNGKVQNARN